jgi:hypothetical protein
VATIETPLRAWMAEHEYASVAEVRGSVSRERVAQHITPHGGAIAIERLPGRRPAAPDSAIQLANIAISLGRVRTGATYRYRARHVAAEMASARLPTRSSTS